MNSCVYHYDAFSKEANKGNPAGVVLDASEMSEEKMQQIAYQVGFNETAFVLPSNKADIRLRYFTPGQEVDLCGHATVASVYALYTRKLIDKRKITIETKAGILDIAISEEDDEIKIVMEQSQYRDQPFLGSYKRLAEALGIEEEDIDPSYPVVYGYTGLWTLLVPIKSLKKFLSMHPDNQSFPEVLEENSRASIHPFCLETYHAEAIMHGRHFSSPYSGTKEDPVTGTASGVMGAYYTKYILQENNKVNRLIVEQGQEIDRDGMVEVMIEEKDDQINVHIAGTAVFVEEKAVFSS